MTIQDLKITSEDYTSKDIAGLPDRPSEAGMSAADLKARFDAATKRIVQPKFNQLIDLLNGTEGADNIGIKPIEGLSGYTVQQILLAIKLLLDDKKNTEQSDREIAQKFDASEAQALVKEISFSEGSGVFTIIKYDGSVQTYDTALEKVALDVRLDGQQFVLTLADGSEQRVDLSAFITQTEVKNSDTITLAIENGAIVARITSGSVMLSHLNAEVTAYIEAKELAAYQSAQAASVSEQNALNSANTAKASEQAAKTCQEQACSCATQAGLSRDAAKASEQAAKEAAQEARDYSGGDFVTNTAFNQFKETVPTLDDGKVPVQQGGLYINSETTEEDKAEAIEAIKGIGLSAKDVGALLGGMNECLDFDNPPSVICVVNGWDSNIINRPPNFGSVFGILFTTWFYREETGENSGHKTQTIIVEDGRVLSRKYELGIWTAWSEKYLPLDGSVPMSGKLRTPVQFGSIGQTVDNGCFRIDGGSDYDKGAFLTLFGKDNESGRFQLVAVDGTNRVELEGYADSVLTWNGKQLFGEHNKPSGSYTGNGSATKRIIETGGVGDWVGVNGTHGTMAMLNKKGGWYKSGTEIIGFGADVAYAAGGNIYLFTTVTQLNANNETYEYEWM